MERRNREGFLSILYSYYLTVSETSWFQDGLLSILYSYYLIFAPDGPSTVNFLFFQFFIVITYFHDFTVRILPLKIFQFFIVITPVLFKV